MEEFFIDVRLERGITRIQVEEITPEEHAILNILLFTIDFYSGKGFTTLTLQLQDGKWFDRNMLFGEDDSQQHNLVLNFDSRNLNYQPALSQEDINRIGKSIADFMVIKLIARMSLFVPVFPKPSLN
jgi:hypothetical protein